MKHLTPAMVQEAHYVPANNMFAFILTEGEEGARKALKRNADAWRDSTVYCPCCTQAYAAWYEKSCEIIINRHALGQKITTDYPVLVIPEHA